MSKIKKYIAIFTAMLMVTFPTTSVSAAQLSTDDEAVSSRDGYSILDAGIIQKAVSEIIPVTDKLIQKYDFNLDGKLSIQDASILQKYLAEFTDELPTEAYTTPTEPATEQTEPSTEATEPTTAPQATYLELDKNKLSLGINEEYTLQTATDETQSLVWKSSDKNVLTVDDGKITPQNVGTATVTCTTANGISAVCNVEIGKEATSISLNSETLYFGIGETFDFESNIPSDSTAYYQVFHSENEAVVTIDESDGVAKAVSAGETKIYCELANGLRAYADVRVYPAPTSAALNKTSLSLKVGETSVLSEHTNSGSYANSFEWKSSNPYVIKITNTSSNKCYIQAMSQGSANITFTTYNNIKVTCKVTVSGTGVKCLDVSTWQGDIDFNKVKAAGYDYVIIRAGYGRETYQKDDMFDTNYTKAKAAGLKVGAYWFSYAMSATEALSEAKACLYCLGNKKLDLPLYYDLEYAPAILNMTSSSYTKMALTFCDAVKAAGYEAGVYASASVWGGYPLKRSEIVKNNYSVWNAQWSSTCSVECDIWQYSEEGSVNGISTAIDCDYIFNLNIVK